LIITQDPEPNVPARRGEEIKVVISAGFPTSMQLVDKNEKNTIVKLSLKNLPEWDNQNILVWIVDSNGRRKYFEKMFSSGESKDLEIVAEPEAVIEVYYFNDMALKQELKCLDKNK